MKFHHQLTRQWRQIKHFNELQPLQILTFAWALVVRNSQHHFTIGSWQLNIEVTKCQWVIMQHQSCQAHSCRYLWGHHWFFKCRHGEDSGGCFVSEFEFDVWGGPEWDCWIVWDWGGGGGGGGLLWTGLVCFIWSGKTNGSSTFTRILSKPEYLSRLPNFSMNLSLKHCHTLCNSLYLMGS